MNTWTKTLAAICAVVLLNGCFYAVTTTTDDFSQTTMTGMRNNRLPRLWSYPATVELNVYRHGPAAGLQSLLNLCLSWQAPTWLFIEKGESLIFLLDGERMALSGDGSTGSRNVMSGGGVLEFAWYRITPQQLYRLARASKVRVKIRGSKGSPTPRFSEINQQRFRDFYDQHVQVVGAAGISWPPLIGSRSGQELREPAMLKPSVNR